ncbi:MAG TPA: cytochrome d ubiquinol oxidase subunit II [Thermoanaerobaculia bacterium]|nr:cytochrome d ubiquinol oxidase subunit II [Thermoanaerobaculia bacterium]
MLDLQVIWFLLIGVLLAGYAILDGFDLGVGIQHLFIARNDRERRVLLNSIGPVWDGNEVWLLTAGGAIFAAFPKVYATVFSGFYLALMLLLVALVLRAVSLEFRSKVESTTWRGAWDAAFAFGSFLPALLFGVAVGNVLRGVPISNDGEFAGSFIGLLNPFSLVVGLLSTAMFVTQGSSWLSFKTEGELRARSVSVGRKAWLAFLALWIVATIYSRFEAPHLWTNYANALTWIAPVAFVIFALAYPFVKGVKSFAISSLAIIALVGIMGQALFPNMVPSFGGLANSLTIRNASSTPLTLKVMLTIALAGVPVVLAYTIWIYRKFMDPVVLDEHSY